MYRELRCKYSGLIGYQLLVLVGLTISLNSLLFAQNLEASKILPIPIPEPLSKEEQAKVDLGRMLWYEKRISRSGELSCNSCHNLEKGGADNKALSIGHGGEKMRVNTPTVFNARYNYAYFYDGRARSLEEQLTDAIEDPTKMASDWDFVVKVLSSLPEYRRYFSDVFSTHKITKELVEEALIAFEKSLVTPNSRFDQWLRGNLAALNGEELAGYYNFKHYGCITCHSGINLGGDAFYKMGKLAPYKTKSDYLGREEYTGVESDRNTFKVPTLRNIDLTGPYFHDGAIDSLEEAVKIMAEIQLGESLSDEEVSQIVAFLKTLTGQMPDVKRPKLPRVRFSPPLF